MISIKEAILTVHRQVALAYIPTEDTSLVVMHIDGNKLNNHVDNLKWATKRESVTNHNKVISHARKVIQMTIDDEVIATFNSVTAASKVIKKSRSAISKACEGINKTAGGFKWTYENDKHKHEVLDEDHGGVPIEDFPNYLIFKEGRVYNTKRKKFLKPVAKGSDYTYVTLCSPGAEKQKKNCDVHRLVAQHFIPNPDKKKFVNHKDFDRANNHVDNLEWVTQSENNKHAKTKKKIVV